MIDLSRIGGPASAAPVSHNHILSAHGGGWFNTVNIRVSRLRRERDCSGEDPVEGARTAR